MTSTHPGLARSLVFAGNTPVEGALSALALEPFVTGRQPYSHAIELHDVDAASPLLPPGAAAALTHNESGLRSHLSCGPGWTLFAMRRRGRTAVVRVCAETDALAREVLELATAAATDAVSDDPAASIGFWHPAVVRPGRCLAEIESARCHREQARHWLNDPHIAINGDGAILAELYRLRGPLSKVEHSTRAALAGNYL
ncbi:MAG: DUF5925 domain-containing protein [Pseudonocardiaceae bacterium]